MTYEKGEVIYYDSIKVSIVPGSYRACYRAPRVGYLVPNDASFTKVYLVGSGVAICLNQAQDLGVISHCDNQAWTYGRKIAVYDMNLSYFDNRIPNIEYERDRLTTSKEVTVKDGPLGPNPPSDGFPKTVSVEETQKAPSPGDQTCLILTGLKKVGKVTVSEVTRLGGTLVPVYAIYLHSDFVYPDSEDTPYEMFMGNTTNYELWFRVRSFGKLTFHKT